MSLPRPRLEPQSCSLSRGPCPASPDRRWPQLPCLCLWDVGVTVPRLPSSGPRRPDARPSSHRETPGQPSSPLPEALGVGPPGTATGSPLPASQRSASCWELRPRVAAPAERPLGGCHLAPRGRGSWPPWSPQWGWSWRPPSRPSQAAGSRGHAVPPGQPPRASLSLPQRWAQSASFLKRVKRGNRRVCTGRLGPPRSEEQHPELSSQPCAHPAFASWRRLVAVGARAGERAQASEPRELGFQSLPQAPAGDRAGQVPSRVLISLICEARPCCASGLPQVTGDGDKATVRPAPGPPTATGLAGTAVGPGGGHCPFHAFPRA